MRRQKGGLKFALKILTKTLFANISAIAVYFVCALFFSLPSTHPPKQNCIPKHEVFIASNGIHLDIILPVENLNPPLSDQLGILPGTMYMAFGWGDKEFYIKTPEWTDLTFKVAFKALFMKSETAMHVTCLPQKPETWKRIAVCTEQLRILNNYIENSFTKNNHGEIQKTDFEGYTRYDDFYEANGSFSLFKTCNVWVNTALKKTGIKTSVWSPFDFGVLFHIKNEK